MDNNFGNEENKETSTSAFENTTETTETVGTGSENSGDGFNSQNGFGDGNTGGEENKKPWFLTPSVDVPKGYNPYRDGESVFEETIKAYPQVFKGAEKLENETPPMYYYRRRGEWGFARERAKKGLGKSSRYIAAILILYLVLTNFIAICIQWAVSGAVAEVLMTVAQYLLIAPALIILANIGLKHKTQSFFRKPQVSKFFIFKWSVMGLGITYAVSILGNIFFTLIQVFGINVNDLSQPIPDTPGSLILYFFTVVICAPLFEEILFRGIFLTHHMKYGCWHAIIVTGILFGLIHQNHQQMLFAAALGIVFGYIDVKAGSIIPSIIAHAVVNFYSFMMTFFLYFTNFNETLSDPTLALDGPAFAVMMSGILNMAVYALIIISVVMLIYELIKNKSDFDLPKGYSFLSEKEKNTIFFSHPVMIVLLVLLAISIMMISFVNFGVTETTLSLFR